MRPVFELLATAGQKTITVPIVDLPWDHQCADAYHSMIDEPDYRTFDEYVAKVAAREGTRGSITFQVHTSGQSRRSRPSRRIGIQDPISLHEARICRHV